MIEPRYKTGEKPEQFDIVRNLKNGRIGFMRQYDQEKPWYLRYVVRQGNALTIPVSVYAAWSVRDNPVDPAYCELIERGRGFYPTARKEWMP